MYQYKYLIPRIRFACPQFLMPQSTCTGYIMFCVMRSCLSQAIRHTTIGGAPTTHTYYYFPKEWLPLISVCRSEKINDPSCRLTKTTVMKSRIGCKHPLPAMKHHFQMIQEQQSQPRRNINAHVRC